jgi:7,8-dihydropterin-6-yl-methyl-4-(beta-D-ribofuranosyl)aminobenzene 5'-phosphate synthase
MPHIPIKHQIDKHFDGLLKLKDNELVPDEFEVELYLTLVENNNVNIISACSHRGITNICEAATSYFNLGIGLILGGFHIKNCTTERTSPYPLLQQTSTQQIGVCHCTGIEKYADLRQELDSTPGFTNHSGL